MKAGSTSSACPILVRNANPIATPASINHRAEACDSDRTTKYAAATISSTSNASGLLNRNISTATGVNASALPAIGANCVSGNPGRSLEASCEPGMPGLLPWFGEVVYC